VTWPTGIEIFENCSTNNKTWEEALNEAKKIGFAEPSSFVITFIEAMVAMQISRSQAIKLLRNHLMYPDLLHNSMGFTKAILTAMVGKWLDSDRFLKILQDKLNRVSIAGCMGKELRYIVLNWSQFKPAKVATLLEEQSKLLDSFFLVWGKFCG
jgi:hypothetical protein